MLAAVVMTVLVIKVIALVVMMVEDEVRMERADITE